MELARQNGEWEAAHAREDVSAVPADLERVLRKHRALKTFATWTPGRKKQYLYWVANAKRPETRRKRIETIAAMAVKDR